MASLRRYCWLEGVLLSAIFLRSKSWIQPAARYERTHNYRRFAGAQSSVDEPPQDLNLLLLDHYDSYTFNLYDQLAQLCRHPPLVLPKDVASNWRELEVILRETHKVHRLDGVILSPGPGRPSLSDLGADIIRCNPKLPILGVCLGHQMLAVTYCDNDNAVICAPCGPVHGHVHSIYHDESCPLFHGVSCPFPATRYHSLVVDTSLSSSSSQHAQTHALTTLLKTTAVCYDPSTQQPIIMGLAHSSNPHYGVQFHPESIGTQPHGQSITRNFLQICQEIQKGQHPMQQFKIVSGPILALPTMPATASSFVHTRQQRQVYVYKISNLSRSISPKEVFASLMANEPYAIWLDGSNHHQVTQCSILTCYQGKGFGGYRVEYYGKEHDVRRQGLYLYRPNPGGDRVNGDSVEVCEQYHDVDILSFLKREHSHTSDHVNMVASLGEDDGTGWGIEKLSEEAAKSQLPFNFRGGHVGYLGYEVRHDIVRRMTNSSNHTHESGGGYDTNHAHNNGLHETATPRKPQTGSRFRGKHGRAVPTAAFLFAQHSLVYDPNKQEWYLVGALDTTDSADERIFQWFKSVERSLQSLSNEKVESVDPHFRFYKSSAPPRTTPLLFRSLRSKATYQRNIAECHEFIRLGESYELCLTNQLIATVKDRDHQRTGWDLYQILRRRNPAPFSAYLNWNSQQQRGLGTEGLETIAQASLAICCSSPERFVSVQRQAPYHRDSCYDDSQNINCRPTFVVESKPIKGTIARVQPTNGNIHLNALEYIEDLERAKDLQSSVKNRAENLMIVDLLRNDLSRVCRIGSVHVPKLMHVESYTTVHQLVSTIRGALDRVRNTVDVLESCFPGGSMTGAPKLRTLELLDLLEEGTSRGPYSGCLGYVSLNGCMDMNIIIRTAVLIPSADGHEWRVSIGTGGAITALSECDDEYNEMLLKAEAVMEAVQEWDDPDRYTHRRISDYDSTQSSTNSTFVLMN